MKTPAFPLRLLALLTLLGPAAGQVNFARAAAPPVGLATTGESYFLSNSLVSIRVGRRTGDLTSLRFHGLELLGGGSGHPYGYWSHAPGRGGAVSTTVTIDPGKNNGERAEVSVRQQYEGNPLGNGPGGSTACDIEIRYALGRDDAGPYTYTILSHSADYPATQIGEARFGAKLNAAVFDYLAIDENRRKIMPTPEDWNQGTQLNMKEARRLNTGIHKGEAEHKYDYSAVQFDIPAFGWAGTRAQVGLWFVNPTIEYLSGGATKVELTGHLDVNEGAAPTLLNYWRGSHYGGSSCVLAAGEAWTRVIGPFQIYCNAGAGPEALWREALAHAAREAAAWPYPWVAGVDYPQRAERGLVQGRLQLQDPQAPALRPRQLLVGLAHADYSVRGGRGGGATRVDWQLDAKYYEFWTRGESNGQFSIPNVRPGVYTLTAIADGVLGEFVRTNVIVAPGANLNLGELIWQPVRHGRQVWEIGIPDRTAAEFRHGDHYWQWGLYHDYPKEFPNDVNFVIGESDTSRDWNYCQCPRADRPEGTTWSVIFDLPTAQSGQATLCLALAATSARSIKLTVNNQPAGTTGPLTDTATIRRDGIRGYWTERDLTFDAALLKAGKNILQLTIPPGGPMSGVEYDYLRLELAPAAAQEPAK